MRSVLLTVRAVLTIVLAALILAANAHVILASITESDGGACCTRDQYDGRDDPPGTGDWKYGV